MAKLNLDGLLQLIGKTPAFHQVLKQVQKKDSIKLALLDVAKPYVMAALHQKLQIPTVVVTAQPETSRKIHEQLSELCNSTEPDIFPEPDALPYQRLNTDISAEQERIQTLYSLAFRKDKSFVPLIVTSASALLHKTTKYEDFLSACHTVSTGMEIEPFQLLKRWKSLGYKLESMVEIPGTMSHRGGIIDIYSPTNQFPARIEFMGNTIDSIRLFDPANQLSQFQVKSIFIVPATEILKYYSSDTNEIDMLLNNLDLSNCKSYIQEQLRQDFSMLTDRQMQNNLQFYAPLFNTGNLLDYLPSDALLVLDEPNSIERAITDIEDQIRLLRNEKVSSGELPSNFPMPYFSWEDINNKTRNRQNIVFSSLSNVPSDRLYQFDFSPALDYAGQLTTFIRKVKQLVQEKRQIVVVSHQASRLSELFEEEDIIASTQSEIRQIPQKRTLTLIQGTLAAGWVIANKTYLFTDSEIFGFIKERRQTKKRPVPRHKLYIDVSPGDYVVHIEHGIGKFTGVTTLKTDNLYREYLILNYAEGDKLYVPTDQIDRMNRYIGSGDQPPTLNRLGTQEWNRTKQKVKEAVEEIAHDLLQLYAAREVISGFAFQSDTVWQQELEASFPYVETPDQLKAQQDVKVDMSKDKPMDRLICGDVGYGKTEIAIRAAFKSVMSDKQVAILVPTTVLAQQHYNTFCQRMAVFPINIEVLSRFKTAKEQSDIIYGLSKGTVDICIGTHRLLQKDVVFKNLGLLIIDEEQRFGVNHKEYLKRMRREVDVLTLSATPIPRTLHMSLVGVRDISTMETPPEDRLPIKTYVAEYNDRLVKEAIQQELERNGQVFFIHNRVQSIEYVSANLQSLIPDAKFAVAHGQMSESRLEKVMTGFTSGNSDVLVCTTIIESGLDMPNVNTLIVNNADRFGLTQLYQLRGRIGRGTNLAHAYFLYDHNKYLTQIAEKRLRTIFEATELGAGFNIAMKDLEIRGAGTLLGTRQSGNISSVGFSLYTRLLANAVEEQKTRRAETLKKESVLPHRPSPSIDLPLSAYIPENYVKDLDIRLSLYQRLAELDTTEQIENLSQELIDRFGALPREVRNLLYAVRIKILAAKTEIESISILEGQIALKLPKGKQFDKVKLAHLQKEGVRIYNNQIRLNYKKLGKEWSKVLEDILKSIV